MEEPLLPRRTRRRRADAEPAAGPQRTLGGVLAALGKAFDAMAKDESVRAVVTRWGIAYPADPVGDPAAVRELRV